jgi:hypothetical protein
VSAILIAMPEKTNNSEKTERKNGNMSELIIDKIRLMIRKDIGLKDILRSVVEFPFKMPTESNLPTINITLHKEIKIPTFISHIIADDNIAVYGIEIDNERILIKYNKENGHKDFERIDLGYQTITVKELFMLLYVLNNLSENDIIEITTTIDNHMNEIENESDLIVKTLKDNGIEI